MNKLLLRIILLLIVFPCLYVIIFLLPHFYYLSFNLCVIAATFICALEIKNMFLKKNIPVHGVISPLIGMSLPLSAYLEIANITGPGFFLKWTLISFIIIFLTGIFIRKKAELSGALIKISSSMLIVLYPGFFLSFLIFITKWENASLKMFFLLSLIFINDITAYVAGKLFGKKLNLIISPNKSIAGFICGFLISICISITFYFVYPNLFRTNLYAMLIFGAVIGIMTITGDLVESVMKRSAGVKDSGVIMIGRGGLLDSVDSILLSAPVFYLLFGFIAN